MLPFCLKRVELLLLFFFILMLVIFRMVDETEVNTFNSQSSSLIKLNNGTVLYLREVNKFLALVCILREENFQKQGQSLNMYIRHLSCEGLNVFLHVSEISSSVLMKRIVLSLFNWNLWTLEHVIFFITSHNLIKKIVTKTIFLLITFFLH